MRRLRTRGLWDPLKPLGVALVIIAIAATWPTSHEGTNQTKLTPNAIRTTLVKDLPDGPMKTRRDTELAKLRAKGWKVGPSYVMQNSRKVDPKWWQRLGTTLHVGTDLHADVYYNADGYTSFTGLDDGNPNTAEMWVDGVAGSQSMWGGIQWDANNSPWTWSEGITVDNELKSPIDKFVCKIAPTLFARPDACGGGWGTSRDILLDGFYNGLQAAGYAFPYCWGQALPCLGYGFLAGFNVRVYADVYYLMYHCMA